MIYILSGNDTKKKNAYLKKLYKDNQPIFAPEGDLTREALLAQVGSVSLFGLPPIVVVENVIKEGNIALSDQDLLLLKNSETTFVFIEEKLLAPELKKYKKYATIEEFKTEVKKPISKMNVFNIAEAFARRDKIGTWVLFREAVALGVSPEEISGIIFWKIKTMLLTGAKTFSAEELKKRSSELVSLYHDSHRGEGDFTIGLEQFILSALNK